MTTLVVCVGRVEVFKECD